MRENPLPQRNYLFRLQRQTRKINCLNCPKCPSCQNRWCRIRRIALFTGLLSSTPEATWHGASIPRPFEGQSPKRRWEWERLGSWEIAQSLERMEQRAGRLGAGGKEVRSSEKGALEAGSKGVRSSEKGALEVGSKGARSSEQGR